MHDLRRAFVLFALLASAVSTGCRPSGDASHPVVDLDVVPKPLRPAAARVEAYALRGELLRIGDGPRFTLEPGYLTIRGDRIVARSSEPPPDGIPVLEVDGLVLPGLIDLHEHLSYAYHPRFRDSIFAGERTPFANRYAWQVDPRYRAFSQRHGAMLSTAGARDVFTAYGELRELVGGTTAVGDTMRYSVPWRDTLARDVWADGLGDLPGGSVTNEVFFLDKDGVRADPPAYAIDPGFLERAASHDTIVLHLCEGAPDDRRTRRELELFLEWARAHPLHARKVVLVHAVGIPGPSFRELAVLGVDRLIWSPYSNLDLYGRTADVGAARDAGFRIALGTDWYPNGTDSLFDELRVAQLVLADQLDAWPADERLALVLANAASMLGRPSGLGLLEPGAPADLIVVPRTGASLLESVLAADADTLELVVVRGRPLLGRTAWMEALLERTWPAPGAGRSFAFDVRPVVGWVAAQVERAFEGRIESVPIFVEGDYGSPFAPRTRRE